MISLILFSNQWTIRKYCNKQKILFNFWDTFWWQICHQNILYFGTKSCNPDTSVRTCSDSSCCSAIYNVRNVRTFYSVWAVQTVFGMFAGNENFELFGLFGVQSRSTVRKNELFGRNISNSGYENTNCSEFGYDQTKNLIRNTDRKYQLTWSTFYRVH